MSTTVVKRYVWKTLTNDGLLKEPNDCGQHYDKESINTNYNSQWIDELFASEEVAIARFVEFYKKHGSSCDSQLVLVPIYQIVCS